MPSVSECERGRGGWAKEIWLQEPRDDGGQSGEATTVDALAAFVAAHPHLERAAFPFADARAVPAPHALPPPAPARASALRLLRIAYLEPKVSLIGLALALDRLFPALENPTPKDVFASRGDELDLLLFALRAGRSGEHRLGSVGQEVSTAPV